MNIHTLEVFMKKVTPEELQQLEELKNSLYVILTAIGELHLTKVMLEKELITLTKKMEEEENKFILFQEKERVLFEQLQTKYNSTNINLDTGEVLG